MIFINSGHVYFIKNSDFLKPTGLQAASSTKADKPAFLIASSNYVFFTISVIMFSKSREIGYINYGFDYNKSTRFCTIVVPQSSSCLITSIILLFINP